MATQLPTYSIQVNPYEAGVLMGMVEGADGLTRSSLSGVRSQLIAVRRDIDKAEGVTRKLLPNGMLEIRDADGNRMVRPPYSWEIEGN